MVLCAYYISTSADNSVMKVKKIPIQNSISRLIQQKQTVFCKQCDSFKPNRTHHCRICNTCAIRMDHHCPWVVNCVGQRSHKSFILFSFYCTIGFCQFFFNGIMWLKWVISEGQFQNQSYLFLIVLLLQFSAAMCFFILTLSMTFIHTNFAVQNLTTIEARLSPCFLRTLSLKEKVYFYNQHN